jgi:hypothetical protein
MGKYSIIISPVIPDGDVSTEQSRLKILVDTSHPEPRVTSISVSSDAPDGITSKNFPEINLPAITQALAIRFLAQFAESQLELFGGESTTSSDVAESSPARTDTPSIRRTTPTKESTRDRAAELTRTTEDNNGRAYRKMPDTDELREKYRSIGTVTGLAKYYGVPRHTAQGWMGRLRKIDTVARYQ